MLVRELRRRQIHAPLAFIGGVLLRAALHHLVVLELAHAAGPLRGVQAALTRSDARLGEGHVAVGGGQLVELVGRDVVLHIALPLGSRRRSRSR